MAPKAPNRAGAVSYATFSPSYRTACVSREVSENGTQIILVFDYAMTQFVSSFSLTKD